jgi:hypothetical protein
MKNITEPARTGKRNCGLTSQETEIMWDLLPTIGIYARENDCNRISDAVGCCLKTVEKYHQMFLEKTGSTASSALVTAGSSVPTARACTYGGDGGPSAARCWSAPPQVTSKSSRPVRCLAARLPVFCRKFVLVARVGTYASRVHAKLEKPIITPKEAH